MSEKLNQCCQRLSAEIKTAEACLANAGQHLAAVTGERLEGLDGRLKNAMAKCDAKRDHARSAGERVRQVLEQKKSEWVGKYEDWRTDREIEKLEKHANTLQDQAVVVAAYALLEAEVAILEALKARKIAIEVAG